MLRDERIYFHIEEFGVDENHKRKGIAAAMIDFVKEDAKKRGFKRIELDMWEFNDGALAFYEMAEKSVAFQKFCYDSFGL